MLLNGNESTISTDALIQLEFVIFLFASGLQVVFSVILVISACFIASWVERSTGKKHNSYLLAWHVINLFLLIVTMTFVGVSCLKVNYENEGSQNQNIYTYYNYVSLLVQLNTEFYVDLFLLWLLYRFMKP